MQTDKTTFKPSKAKPREGTPSFSTGPLQRSSTHYRSKNGKSVRKGRQENGNNRTKSLSHSGLNSQQ